MGGQKLPCSKSTSRILSEDHRTLRSSSTIDDTLSTEATTSPITNIYNAQDQSLMSYKYHGRDATHSSIATSSTGSREYQSRDAAYSSIAASNPGSSAANVVVDLVGSSVASYKRSSPSSASTPSPLILPSSSIISSSNTSSSHKSIKSSYHQYSSSMHLSSSSTAASHNLSNVGISSIASSALSFNYPDLNNRTEYSSSSSSSILNLSPKSERVPLSTFDSSMVPSSSVRSHNGKVQHVTKYLYEETKEKKRSDQTFIG